MFRDPGGTNSEGLWASHFQTSGWPKAPEIFLLKDSVMSGQLIRKERKLASSEQGKKRESGKDEHMSRKEPNIMILPTPNINTSYLLA